MMRTDPYEPALLGVYTSSANMKTPQGMAIDAGNSLVYVAAQESDALIKRRVFSSSSNSSSRL